MSTCVHGLRAQMPTPELCDDLATAVRSGRPIAPVLRAHGVRRGTYYGWISIGRGELVEWWDGCVVDARTFHECWTLAVAMARARLEWDRNMIERLERLADPTYTVSLQDPRARMRARGRVAEQAEPGFVRTHDGC
jgi:hypothetical protein